MMNEQQNIIIYKTNDGKASVALFAKDGKIWLNQKSIAELFGTSKQSISRHIINILNDCELDKISVVKDFLTTADDGKTYNVINYGKLDISGGIVSGAKSGAVVYTTGAMTQSGGTVSRSGLHNVYVAAGTLTMTGGTNEAAAQDGLWVSKGASA